MSKEEIYYTDVVKSDVFVKNPESFKCWGEIVADINGFCYFNRKDVPFEFKSIIDIDGNVIYNNHSSSMDRGFAELDLHSEMLGQFARKFSNLQKTTPPSKGIFDAMERDWLAKNADKVDKDPVIKEIYNILVGYNSHGAGDGAGVVDPSASLSEPSLDTPLAGAGVVHDATE